MRNIVFGCVMIGFAAALMFDIVSATPALPFYDSADLTPRWSRSVEHRIADFKLVTQTGQSITRADLIGRVHIATFIYTHCAGVCPAMVTQLAKVQKAIADRNDAVLVSYSVTPQVDTPQMLAQFGAERRIDPERWKLVTGDSQQIYSLARASYFAEDSRASDDQFLHTEKALLVDREGRLRGVYNATLPHEIDKLIADISVLLR
jgi:protein SCO1